MCPLSCPVPALLNIGEYYILQQQFPINKRMTDWVGAHNHNARREREKEMVYILLY